MKKLTFIDLFAGCGGLSEGFLSSNKYEGLAHVEWEIPMVRTLRHRLTDRWKHSNEDSLKRVIHFDIQKTKELINGNWGKGTLKNYGATNHKQIINGGLRSLVGNKKVDLIIGGPPCQAYSIAGRAQDKNSMKDDYRNYLFESFVKVVDEFRPTVFVFENVPGMLSAQPGGKPVTERIYEAFKKIGYEIPPSKDLKNAVFSAADLGVPQKRNRVIIIGIKTANSSDLKLHSIYNEIKKQFVKKHSTVHHAISHLPKFKPSNKTEKIYGRKTSYKAIENIDLSDDLIPRYQNQRDIKVFSNWLKNNMNSWNSDVKIKFYNDLVGKKSSHGKYRSLDWNKPSPTIVAHLYKDGLMFIHPDEKQSRSITVREAASLQSFPEDFIFKERMGYNYKMIGNAVPPMMAKNIAIAIYFTLNR
ncbi:DNA cytosine methyltransferase [Flavobacteriales bacterium]|jgi:DNA (cytosine-5)-methyltransferase 1|nr:DNA cytosine methyltransferase [Flavobacteriales bacterium]